MQTQDINGHPTKHFPRMYFSYETHLNLLLHTFFMIIHGLGRLSGNAEEFQADGEKTEPRSHRTLRTGLNASTNLQLPVPTRKMLQTLANKSLAQCEVQKKHPSHAHVLNLCAPLCAPLKSSCRCWGSKVPLTNMSKGNICGRTPKRNSIDGSICAWA